MLTWSRERRADLGHAARSADRCRRPAGLQRTGGVAGRDRPVRRLQRVHHAIPQRHHESAWAGRRRTACERGGRRTHRLVGARADPVGDPRGSSANGLTAEFLGDYVYAAATNDLAVGGVERHPRAPPCASINAYRASLYTASPIERAQRARHCPATFGNSDIFGGTVRRPDAVTTRRDSEKHAPSPSRRPIAPTVPERLRVLAPAAFRVSNGFEAWRTGNSGCGRPTTASRVPTC